MAAKLSLPNIAGCSFWVLARCRAGTGEDGFEQFRAHHGEGPRLILLTRPGKFGVLLGPKRAAMRARRVNPLGKGLRRYRGPLQTAGGKALPGKLGGQAWEGSLIVGLQIELGRHAGHGVNLTAQLRNKKA